jgi:hypothetical protein
MRGGFIRNGCLVLGILILGPVACCPQELDGKLRCEAIAKWNSPLFFARGTKAGSATEYTAIASGTRALFLKDGVAFQIPGLAFQVQFLDSNNDVQPRGEDPQATRVNYLVGDQARDWLRDLPTYQTVVYGGIYPGIDLRFGFSGTRLKSEFVVAPGSDPTRIRFRYNGLGSPSIDERGDAVYEPAPGRFREEAPIVFQWKHGTRVPVPARFKLSADGVISFELGAFDAAIPLTIDPVVSYSSYLGGQGDSAATAIAADSNGNVYVAGWTDSVKFPTAGPLQGGIAGEVNAFVLKLNAAGNTLLYATYIGGSGDDRAYGIAIDGGGNAYVTGSTTSANFPTRVPIQSTLQGGRDAFVLKLNAAGNGLTYSTYLGGTGLDYGYGIAVDWQGNAYVTGDTTSQNFPTLTPFQAVNGGVQDAFVTKISSTGTMVYSTYLGGRGVDHGAAIAVDTSGNVYVTGGTFSSNFPTANAFQAANAGAQNAFVTKLAAGGNSLVYSTYLGGSGGALGALESGSGIAVDSLGEAFVTGTTSSSNFPIAAAFQPAPGGGTSTAFVSKLNALGTSLAYSTYLGGSSMDFGQAIALDLVGNAYVAGYTASADFPLAAPVQSALAGGYDAFVVQLNPWGSALNFGTYYGGSGLDAANGIASDMAGNVYVAGQTQSADFPVVSAFQSSVIGTIEAFVFKLNIDPAPDFSLGMSPGSQTVAAGGSTTYTVTQTGSNGFSGTVNLGVSGLPSGVTGSFNPTSLAGSGSSTLTINTSSGASTGTFTATVTGTSGSQSHNTSSGLTITGGGSSSGPPSTVSVTPSSGSGSAQTFAFAFSDPHGTSDILSAKLDINATLTSSGACYLFYSPGANKIYLISDAGAWQAPLTLGVAGTTQNSECSLNAGASSAIVSGTNLTLNLALSFKAGFAGAKNIYMEVQNATEDSGCAQRGTWTVTASTPAPTIALPPSTVSVTPNVGSSLAQTFAFVFSDPNGTSDILSAKLDINATLTSSGACYLFYSPGANAIYLISDAGAWQAPLNIGVAGTTQNSECTLDAGASSVIASGTNLTLNLALTFSAAFAGAKNIYMEVQNATQDSGWAQRGTWTVP